MVTPAPDWDLVPVKGYYIGTDGNPIVGRVTFTPKVNRLVDRASLRTVITRAISIDLVNGQFQLFLPATDDPDITGFGFTYTVKEDFTGGASYDIAVPLSAATSGGVDLSIVAPQPPNSGNSLSPITRLEFENAKATLVNQIETDLRNPASMAGSVLQNAVESYVYLPAPSGDATTDTRVLTNALAALKPGEGLVLPPARAGRYKLADSLHTDQHVVIRGHGVVSNYAGRNPSGQSAFPPVRPFLLGSVLEMTVPGRDALILSGSGQSSVLTGFGIEFVSGLSSTGRGINARPTATAGNGHEQGVIDSLWSNLSVAGHDGDHYAYDVLNPQYWTTVNLRSYGGGGMLTETDAGAINAGNGVHDHPFFNVRNRGSAHGIAHKAAISGGEPGMVNFLVYQRPQVALSGPAQSPDGTQLAWTDKLGAGIPQRIDVYQIDLEGLSDSGRLPDFGYGTTLHDNGIIDLGERALAVQVGQGAGGASNAGNGNWTAVGYKALAQLTTGTGLTAVGRESALAVTTALDVTAIGAGAGRNLTGALNTTIGRNAGLGAPGATSDSITAVGTSALTSLTTGRTNAAVGVNAGLGVTSGSGNTLVGPQAGFLTGGATVNQITTGSNNTLVGNGAGSINGGALSGAVVLGADAGSAGNNGVAVGAGARTTEGAVAIGSQTSVTGQNGIAMGVTASASATNSMALGVAVTATAIGTVAIGRDAQNNSASASVQNDFVLGTVNHRYKLPGLPTTKPATAGYLWNNLGMVSVS